MAVSLQDILDQKREDFIKKEKKDQKKVLEEEGRTKEEISEIMEEMEDDFGTKSTKEVTTRSLLMKAEVDLQKSKLVPATHIGSYIHPYVKFGINSDNTTEVKGYLFHGSYRSSLYEYNLIGGAACIPQAKLLEAELPDGDAVRTHWQKQTSQFRTLISEEKQDTKQMESTYQTILEKSKNCAKTNHRVKQIFFPLGKKEYRLFSLLPCSILLWELKKRIRAREWSVEEKEGKTTNRRLAFFDYVYRKFGGTKPQNISYLNSENGGNAYLLTSLPPTLRRTYQLPTNNFFNTVRIYRPRQDRPNALVLLFDALQASFVSDPNTDWSRRKRKGIIQAIIERGVIQPAEGIRQNAPSAWSEKDNYSALPEVQKIWLDPGRDRESFTDPSLLVTWPDQIAEQIAKFVVATFQRLMKTSKIKEKLTPDDAFTSEIQKIARGYIDE